MNRLYKISIFHMIRLSRSLLNKCKTNFFGMNLSCGFDFLQANYFESLCWKLHNWRYIFWGLIIALKIAIFGGVKIQNRHLQFYCKCIVKPWESLMLDAQVSSYKDLFRYGWKTTHNFILCNKNLGGRLSKNQVDKVQIRPPKLS